MLTVSLCLFLAIGAQSQALSRGTFTGQSAADQRSKVRVGKKSEQHSAMPGSAITSTPQGNSPAITFDSSTHNPAQKNTDGERRLVTVTIWLAVVGALQFIALCIQAVVFWRTLRAINRQARIMEHHSAHLSDLATAAEKNSLAAASNAEAAKASAEALMNAERAWVVAKPTNWNPQIQVTTLSTAGSVKRNAFSVNFKNVGKTPARLVETSMKYVILEGPIEELPMEPQYETPSSHEGMILPPHDEASEDRFGAVAFLQPNALFFSEGYEKLLDQKTFLYAYGFISYRDVHGRDLRNQIRLCLSFPPWWRPQSTGVSCCWPGGIQSRNLNGGMTLIRCNSGRRSFTPFSKPKPEGFRPPSPLPFEALLGECGCASARRISSLSRL